MYTAVIEPENPEGTIAVLDYEHPDGGAVPKDLEVAKSTVVDVVDARDSSKDEEQRAANLRTAHRKSVVANVVEPLVLLVGAPLTAWLSGVNETRAVRQWAAGEREPHPLTGGKLQLALQVATFLDEEGETDVINAWFRGLNPALDDQSPADLIRIAEGDNLSDVGRRILAAAREFVDN